MGMARIMRAAAHGAYVATTGDPSRLRELRQEAETTSTMAESWKAVGDYLCGATREAASCWPQREKKEQT